MHEGAILMEQGADPREAGTHLQLPTPPALTSDGPMTGGPSVGQARQGTLSLGRIAHAQQDTELDQQRQHVQRTLQARHLGTGAAPWVPCQGTRSCFSSNRVKDHCEMGTTRSCCFWFFGLPGVRVLRRPLMLLIAAAQSRVCTRRAERGLATASPACTHEEDKGLDRHRSWPYIHHKAPSKHK